MIIFDKYFPLLFKATIWQNIFSSCICALRLLHLTSNRFLILQNFLCYLNFLSKILAILHRITTILKISRNFCSTILTFHINFFPFSFNLYIIIKPDDKYLIILMEAYQTQYNFLAYHKYKTYKNNLADFQLDVPSIPNHYQ